MQPAAGQVAAAAPYALPVKGLDGIGQVLAVGPLASSLAFLQQPQPYHQPSSSVGTKGRAAPLTPAAVAPFQTAAQLQQPAESRQQQQQPQPRPQPQPPLPQPPPPPPQPSQLLAHQLLPNPLLNRSLQLHRAGKSVGSGSISSGRSPVLAAATQGRMPPPAAGGHGGPRPAPASVPAQQGGGDGGKAPPA